jgi:hypothetical protein
MLEKAVVMSILVILQNKRVIFLEMMTNDVMMLLCFKITKLPRLGQ